MATKTGKLSYLISLIGLVILCLYLFLFGINDSDFLNTEAHRAIPAREILESGDWVVTRIAEKIYMTKPPLFFWLIAFNSWPAGEVSHWSARLPTSISAFLCVLAVLYFGSKVRGRQAGLVSAFVFATCGLVLEKSMVAEIDMNFTLWTAISLFCLFQALAHSKGWELWWLGSYFFLAMAFLTKGPPIFLFFYGTMVMFLLLDRQWKPAFNVAHLGGIMLFLFISGAWILSVVNQVGWDPLTGNLQQEVTRRMFNLNRLHPNELFFYPLGILAGLAPWTLFLIPSFSKKYSRSYPEKQRLLRFLWSWVISGIVLFSLMSSKSNRYLLPLYPALGLLVGLVWDDFLSSRLSKHQETFMRSIMYLFIGILTIGGLVFCGVVVFMPDMKPAIPLIIPSLAVAVSTGGWWLVRRGNYYGFLAVLILMAVLFKFVFVTEVIPIRNSEKSGRPYAQLVNDAVPRGAIVNLVYFRKPQVLFYMDARVRHLNSLSDIKDLMRQKVDHSYYLLTEMEIQSLGDTYIKGLTELARFSYHGKYTVILLGLRR